MELEVLKMFKTIKGNYSIHFKSGTFIGILNIRKEDEEWIPKKFWHNTKESEGPCPFCLNDSKYFHCNKMNSDSSKWLDELYKTLLNDKTIRLKAIMLGLIKK